MIKKVVIGLIGFICAAVIGVGSFLFAFNNALDLDEFVADYEKAYRQKVSFRDHVVTRGTHKLYSREYGSPDADHTLIMMHGFPDNVRLYDALAPILATDHRVITFDFLGWGQSDKPIDHRYNPDGLLADLEAVIEHFDLDSLVVVAHDLSGLPTIDWALDNPDRVTRLILLNTVYHSSSARKPSAAVKLFSTPGLQRNVVQFVASRNDRLWQSRLTTQGQILFENQQALDTYLNLFVHAAPSIRPAFFGMTAQINQATDERLSKLDQIRNFPKPVTIIFGAEDTVLTAELAQEFHELFPNSQLHLIDGAGHFVQLDDPQAVAGLMLDALTN